MHASFFASGHDESENNGILFSATQALIRIYEIALDRFALAGVVSDHGQHDLSTLNNILPDVMCTCQSSVLRGVMLVVADHIQVD